MARIRTIKPEFFTSADVCGLSPLARLLYIATWCEADREGRLVWNLRTLKLRYFPEENCNLDDLAGELIDRGLVSTYEADGRALAWIPTFLDHQNINPRETDSRLPPPLESTRQARVSDASVTRSGEGKGREGKGKEGTREGSAADAAPLSAPPCADADGEAACGDIAQPQASQAKGRRKGQASEVGARVLARINAIVGSQYDYSPQLEARIRDGVSESDLLAVVEAKARNGWWVSELRLRPKTLFGPENFREYLAAAKAPTLAFQSGRSGGTTAEDLAYLEAKYGGAANG